MSEQSQSRVDPGEDCPTCGVTKPTIEELNREADRKHAKEMKEMKRNASVQAFYSLMVVLGYVGTGGMLVSSAYFGYQTGSPGIFLMLGLTAVLTFTVTMEFRGKRDDN